MMAAVNRAGKYIWIDVAVFIFAEEEIHNMPIYSSSTYVFVILSSLVL